jgi:prenyltransferase beta subunit
MTIRLDMHRAVIRGGKALGDSAEAVRDFLRRQLAPDGGFQGRDGRSDLYYTVFGLEASLALDIDIPRERIDEYLHGFTAGESLDLVNLASLIRCRANMSDFAGREFDTGTRENMARRLSAYRSSDGGFNTAPGTERGSAYGGFLALGAWQDLGVSLPDADGVVESVVALQMPDGGYANESTMTASATPATAAAVCVLHYLNRPVPSLAIRWLLEHAHPLGGFTAISCGADGGMPDLLSTATALHALSLVGVPTSVVREKHLDYLDSLWNPQGGFQGHEADEVIDCEYTYYGLLSLGSLTE